MKYLHAGLAVLVTAAMLGVPAQAKTWTQQGYQCSDQRQVGWQGIALPPMLLGTAIVMYADNVGQCIQKCNAMAQCHSISLLHVAVPNYDATHCKFYAKSSVPTIYFPTFQDTVNLWGLWGAVCSKP